MVTLRVVYNGTVALSPGSCTFLDVADIKAFCRHYSIFCGDTLAAIESEIALLKDMFTREEELPKTLLEFYVFMSPHKILFPRIFTAIQVAATVPVSSSSAERSFSALKRIKSYLRSTMSEERGSDLGVLHVNRNILSLIDEEDILNRFAEKNRRIR